MLLSFFIYSLIIALTRHVQNNKIKGYYGTFSWKPQIQVLFLFLNSASSSKSDKQIRTREVFLFLFHSHAEILDTFCHFWTFIQGNKPSCNSQFYSNNRTLSHFARLAKVFKAWKFYRIQLVKVTYIQSIKNWLLKTRILNQKDLRVGTFLDYSGSLSERATNLSTSLPSLSRRWTCT